MTTKDNLLIEDYAQSFVDRVSDHSEIWEMYDQIETLVSIIRDNKLNRLLLSATVSLEDKAAFIRTIRQSSFWQINTLLEDMIRGGHPSLLLDVLLRIQSQISTAKNEFEAQLVSVYPFTEEQKSRLCQLVEERFSLRIRRLAETLDRTLVGGFILTVNHKVIDASIRTQLQDVRTKL